MLSCEILQLLRILLLYLYNVEFDVNPPSLSLSLSPFLVNDRLAIVDIIIFLKSCTTDNFCMDDLNTPLPPLVKSQGGNYVEINGGINVEINGT